MANFLKKLFTDTLPQRAIDHPELYGHRRSYPRFKLPTEDKLFVNGREYLIRDVSLSGVSIWLDESKGREFLGKEEGNLSSSICFFDNTTVDAELKIIRFDQSVVAFEFTDGTKTRIREELSKLLAPIELGKSMHFVSNNDRELTSDGPTYWYRGRNNTDLFIWVEKDKIKRWQLTFRGTFVEYVKGRFSTGVFDEYKNLKQLERKGNPLILLDQEINFEGLRDAYVLLKSIEEDEQGLINILVNQIKEVN